MNYQIDRVFSSKVTDNFYRKGHFDAYFLMWSTVEVKVDGPTGETTEIGLSKRRKVDGTERHKVIGQKKMKS